MAGKGDGAGGIAESGLGRVEIMSCSQMRIRDVSVDMAEARLLRMRIQSTSDQSWLKKESDPKSAGQDQQKKKEEEKEEAPFTCASICGHFHRWLLILTG